VLKNDLPYTAISHYHTWVIKKSPLYIHRSYRSYGYTKYQRLRSRRSPKNLGQEDHCGEFRIWRCGFTYTRSRLVRLMSMNLFLLKWIGLEVVLWISVIYEQAWCWRREEIEAWVPWTWWVQSEFLRDIDVTHNAIRLWSRREEPTESLCLTDLDSN
jgi:hypothetical protein